MPNPCPAYIGCAGDCNECSYIGGGKVESKLEFIVWDREDKKMGQQIIKHVCAEDGTEFKVIAFVFKPDSMFSKTKIITLAESLDSTRYTPYQYIHRKDKDGNKVYAGSRISAGSYKYIIRYDNEACEFSATRITKDKSVLKINIGSLSSNCKIKVIGHIAEEG